MSRERKCVSKSQTKEETQPCGEKIKEKFADAVDISKDVILGIPLISTIGDREITIENYVGILEYTDLIIRIKCKSLNLKIEGKNLELKTMTQSFLYITGRVACFSFEY